MISGLTPPEEDAIIAANDAAEQRIINAMKLVTPTMSPALEDLVNTFPNTDLYILTATAKAMSFGIMNEKGAKDFLTNINYNFERDAIKNYEEPKKKGNSNWLTGGLKGALRWGIGGANYTLDVGSGAVGYVGTTIMSGVESLLGNPDINLQPSVIPQQPAAPPNEVFNPEQLAEVLPEYTTGTGNPKKLLWDQTALGQMVSNPDLIGTGFFPNKEIYERAGASAREVRGTLNGQAASLGRVTASVVTQPGTLQYAVLSGILDAGFALAVPAVPAFKPIKAGVIGGLEVVAPLRSGQILHNAESFMIIPSKVKDFLRSAGGRSVVKKLVKVSSVDEAMTIFPTANAKFWQEVVDAKDVASVQNLLSDTLGLGDITRGIGPKSFDDINISRWDTVKREMPWLGTQKESKVARLMAKMPGQQVIIAGGSDREVAQSIKNIKNYLVSIKMARPERERLVELFTRAINEGDGSIRNVVKEMEDISKATFKQMGVDDSLNKTLHQTFKEYKEIIDDSLYGAADDAGTSADFGGNFHFTIENGSVIPTSQPLNTAIIQTELLKHAIFLPDPRRVRRIVAGNLAWLTSKQSVIKVDIQNGVKIRKKWGELRAPISWLEHIQNDVWRPFTLSTGGYVFRNMGDSLLRQSFAPNIQTGIFHPFELIQVAMFKKFKGDIYGVSFKGDPEDLIRSGQTELAESAGSSFREYASQQSILSRQQKTGVWRLRSIGNGIEDFSKAIAAEMALLNGDAAVRLAAEGKSVDEILQWASTTGEGNKYVRQIQNMWTNRNIVDPATGKLVKGSATFIDKTGKIDLVELRQFFESVTLGRLAASTGNDPRLIEIVATGEWTDAAGNIIPALLKHKTGQISGYSDEFLSEINGIVKDPNIKLTNFYKSQITVNATNKSSRLQGITDSMDRSVDIFFGQLYPKRELFLNRSPVFRQYYFKVIEEFIDELAPGQVKEILRSVQDAAKLEKVPYTEKFLAKYVGSKKLADTILDKSNGNVKSTGKLLRDELDAYAKGYALDETKKLFYNVAEKSQFADIMRIISPFGSAWAEVLTKWGKTLSTDPEAFKRSTKSVQSLIDADPNNDGRGFFYKDPNSGEYVFNYPMSEHLSPFITTLGGAALGFIVAGPVGIIPGAVTGFGPGKVAEKALGGLGVDMVAPAKSLNMGMNINPGMGPYIQIAADKIIPQKPKYDFIRKLFMPYGVPDVAFVIAPAWLDKAFQAFNADPNNDRIFADTVLQVMEAEAMSGKYDLTTLKGGKELEDASMQKARILLALRAFGQFLGPVRPVPQIKVPLSEENKKNVITVGDEKIDLSKIDVHATELSKVFRQLQEEDYDTSVRKFLELFGDDAFLYLAGKTKATVGGLDASKEFSAWERGNTKFFDTYEEVAGYFAPIGTEFDYQVYLRQIELGLRELLKPDELIAESQRLVGVAFHRELVTSAGFNVSKEEKKIIQDYRKELYKKYPGFARSAVDINKQPANISVLYEAAFDSRMDDNPIAKATREYLDTRDFALKIAEERGFGLGAEANDDLKEILRNEGERLSDLYPEFTRLWDRLLFSEVDIEG